MKSFFGLWSFPVLLMVLIYLPAAIFGIFHFRDIYATIFLALLIIFVTIYLVVYLRLPDGFFPRIKEMFWAIGDQVNWRAMAWLSVFTYLATLVIAGLTTDVTPLGAALRGGSALDIAEARANFFANRVGVESLLRYLAVILGRAVMPFLVILGYWRGYKYRHLMLLALLLCYFVFLEKVLPLFIFLPLIVLQCKTNNVYFALLNFSLLCGAFLLMGLLASGSLHEAPRNSELAAVNVKREWRPPVSNKLCVTRDGVCLRSLKEHGQHFYPLRHAILLSLPLSLRNNEVVFSITTLLNRALWLPYVTAYDWLRFQDEVFEGKLTYGRSIGIVSWLMGEDKLRVERMVYHFQGLSGKGSANTVFFVDAKIAFGWFGVILYCIVFTLIAKVILSSNNTPAKLASMTGFFTVCLSPLTASILSGGLFFYIIICLFVRQKLVASS